MKLFSLLAGSLAGSKDIKIAMNALLSTRAWEGVAVLDFPAGSGASSRTLHERGADVSAWDMFPEFFRVDALQCASADLQRTFPASDGRFDFALFQEGIEHLPNQLFALQEFNRVLKDGGTLLLTTPNYSSLRSRLAYLFFEAEHLAVLPPNEVESTWSNPGDGRIYFGHLFLLGIQRLRCLAELSGFAIERIHSNRIRWISVFAAPFVLPFSFVVSVKAALRAYRNTFSKLPTERRKIVWTILRLNFHPAILFCGHLLVSFRKISSASNALMQARSVRQGIVET